MTYATVLVGTDGSEPSLRAVQRAGQIARLKAARLVVACAYASEASGMNSEAQYAMGEDVFQVFGANPAEWVLRSAVDRASQAGVSAQQLQTAAVNDRPIPTLLAEQRRADADLLVVGNRGLNTLVGRTLGSVPSEVARKAPCDVLIVHTTE